MKEEGSPVDIVSWGFQKYMRYGGRRTGLP